MRSNRTSNDIKNSIEEINLVIGRNIKNIRILHEMTRKQLSEKICVSQQQLAKYENGINQMSISKLILISKSIPENLNSFLMGTNIDEAMKNIDLLEDEELITIASNFRKIKDQSCKEAIKLLVNSVRKIEKNGEHK